MLKMNDLVKLSNTPKSTILYYIKENLLPEPYKDKPNFHLYDESCVKLLEFIKYLQTNFNASISQIKELFFHPEFEHTNPYESLISLISIIMGNEGEHFSPQSLCEEFSISEETLTRYVEEGLLSPRDGIFTKTERNMLAIISKSDELELKLIHTYIQTAKQLSKQEIETGLNGLYRAENKDEKLKHTLDILLVLKPYIMNMTTLKAYQD